MRASGAPSKVVSGQSGRASREERGVGIVWNMCFACACALEWDSSLDACEVIEH
jgi:hypothetical protein